jgi:four helix bundle protein
MQNAANLRVTGEARTLAVAVYRATTRFPAAERFGLTAQMRRAAVSVGSNIAEGCGRFGNRELVQFLQIALGSASELEFQAQIARDLTFLSEDTDGPLLDQIDHVKRMLARLIKSHRSRQR